LSDACYSLTWNADVAVGAISDDRPYRDNYPPICLPWTAVKLLIPL